MLDKSEDKLINHLLSVFSLSINFKNEIVAKLKILQNLYNELGEFVFE